MTRKKQGLFNPELAVISPEVESNRPVMVQGHGALPIDHEVPETLEAVYCNHFVIQNIGGSFQLLGFQVNPPDFVRMEDASKAKSVKAKGKVRVVIPADQFVKLAQAMQLHLNSLVR